jgi:hypothetical protein
MHAHTHTHTHTYAHEASSFKHQSHLQNKINEKHNTGLKIFKYDIFMKITTADNGDYCWQIHLPAELVHYLQPTRLHS